MMTNPHDFLAFFFLPLTLTSGASTTSPYSFLPGHTRLHRSLNCVHLTDSSSVIRHLPFVTPGGIGIQ